MLPATANHCLNIASLFSGIGGFELGLSRAGHNLVVACENNPEAAAVLRTRFPQLRLKSDVRTLRSLPRGVSLITAGFPCQDLSQAGQTAGIFGENSGLVWEVFRLIQKSMPAHVLFENVPFMLRLDKGKAIESLVDRLETLGYDWAYRVIDAQAFGLPQRRPRVFLLGSKTLNPCDVLLANDHNQSRKDPIAPSSFGFYWTEGNRGIGWACESIPALKGGSGLGIPSAPAMILPDGQIATPHLSDAERLQGFPEFWTAPAANAGSQRGRWRLVGNAVNVRVAEWLGRRLARPGRFTDEIPVELNAPPWPNAAYGRAGKRYVSSVGSSPVERKARPLHEFLRFEPTPLSHRAAAGVFQRLLMSRLKPAPILLSTLEAHVAKMGALRTSARAAR